MAAASPAADWHSHWLPPTLLRLLEHRTTAPCIQRISGAPHLAAGRRSRRLEDVALDLDAHRDLLDRAGITWQLLSLSPLWNIDNLPPAEALPLVRSFNDDTCRAVADSPRLFAGLASVPLLDLKASGDELRRARRGGLRGVILPAEAFGTLRQAKRLAPILRTANELDAHVLLHPGYLRRHDAPRCKTDNWWARTIVLEAQHQLGAAMLTLSSSPLLDDYPRISVQVANLGGGPALLSRTHAGR